MSHDTSLSYSASRGGLLHKAICALMAIVLAVGLCPIAPAGQAWAASSVSVAKATRIKNGSTYIVTSTDATKAMSYQDQDGYSQENLKAITVTPDISGDSGTLDFGSASKEDCLWVASGNDTDGYSFLNGTKRYLYASTYYDEGTLGWAYQDTCKFLFDSPTIKTNANTVYYVGFGSKDFSAVANNGGSVTLWEVTGGLGSESVEVTFSVTNGTNAIEGATIVVTKDGESSGTTLTGYTATLDAGAKYTYTVSKSGYEDATGTIDSAAIGTINVTLTESSSSLLTGTEFWFKNGSEFATTDSTITVDKQDGTLASTGKAVNLCISPGTPTSGEAVSGSSVTYQWFTVVGDEKTAFGEPETLGYDSENSKFTASSLKAPLSVAGTTVYVCDVTWTPDGYEAKTKTSPKFTVTVNDSDVPAANPYSVVLAYDNTKGTVTANPMTFSDEDNEIVVTAVPAEGFVVDKVTWEDSYDGNHGSGDAVEGDADNTWVVDLTYNNQDLNLFYDDSGTLTISVVWKSAFTPKYKMLVAEGLVGGTITPIDATYEAADPYGAGFRVLPSSGYRIKYTQNEDSSTKTYAVTATYTDPETKETVTLTNAPHGGIGYSTQASDGSFTTFSILNPPEADVTVSAEFELIESDDTQNEKADDTDTNADTNTNTNTNNNTNTNKNTNKNTNNNTATNTTTPATAEKTVATGVTVDTSTGVATVTKSGKLTAKDVKAAAKAGANSFVLGTKVTKIAAKAFKGTKVKTVTVKSTKLKKKNIKNCFKGSKVTTVKVPAKKLKAYKKLFKKSVVGKKVKVVKA